MDTQTKKKYKLLGLYPTCGNKPTTGRIHCRFCLEIISEYNATAYRKKCDMKRAQNEPSKN